MKRFLAVALLPVAAACSARTAVSTPSRPSPPVVPPATVSPTPSPSLQEPFEGSVSTIDAATRARMTASWRAGCPVPLDDLRLLRLTHVGFDGKAHAGELVVHSDHARAVLEVFRELFEARFPIERMELVDVYGGHDDRSMAANNTSAFNCRPSTGSPGSWSRHAYGLAIDINPVRNPYVTSGGDVEPPAGEAFLDRSKKQDGTIRAGDVVVRAFERIGWSWGGYWASAKDYQHFSADGG